MTVLWWYFAGLAAEWAALAIAGRLCWRWPTRYAALFASIQVCAGFGSPLWIAGVCICAALACTDASRADIRTGLWHWPAWAWLWDDQEDGVDPRWYELSNPTWSKPRREFTWSAIRNSANNFRFVRGVSGAGRPLWYWTGTVRGRIVYAKAGWLSDGYPALSMGAGRGF